MSWLQFIISIAVFVVVAFFLWKKVIRPQWHDTNSSSLREANNRLDEAIKDNLVVTETLKVQVALVKELTQQDRVRFSVLLDRLEGKIDLVVSTALRLEETTFIVAGDLADTQGRADVAASLPGRKPGDAADAASGSPSH